METMYTVKMEIDFLARKLKKRHPKIGYTVVKQGDRVSKYLVHTLLFGDIEIPVKPGRELEATKKLLSELEILATAHAPGLVAPKFKKFPLWMNNECRAFYTRATPKDRGVHRFGKNIRIITWPITSGRPPNPTKQQIVYVSQDVVETFPYMDPDSPKIQGKSGLQTMANDWNLTMYTWVERDGFSPMSARDKLVALNKKLIRELIMALAIPGTGDILSVTKDIAVATVKAFRFR